MAAGLAALPSASGQIVSPVFIGDEFDADSNGVPSQWLNLGIDTSGFASIVESGGVVTITDSRGGGGPTLMQSLRVMGGITGFDLILNVESMAAFSDGRTFSQPEATVGVGGFTGYALVVQFNGATKQVRAFINGPAGSNVRGNFTFPGDVPEYAGGAITLIVNGRLDGFRILSPDCHYDSGLIPYTAAGVAGFATLADLGAHTGIVLGTESAGQTDNGTRAAIAFDAVRLIGFPVITNQAPVAHAGLDQTLRAGATVSLNGALSDDDNTASSALGYSWSFVSKPAGSAAVLNDASIASPSFVADQAGTYILQLVVTDEQGLSSAADEVIISSNNLAPTAVATADFNLAIVGTSVVFNGAGSTDPENDALTYAWSVTSAPAGSTATLTGATTASPSLSVDKEGTFKIALTVSDFLGAGAPATVEVVATQPGTTPEIQIIYASDVVEALPPEHVTTKGNQQAFGNFLKQATKQIQKGDKSAAIAQLEHAIERTDGYALRGAPDGPGPSRDWITDKKAQTDVHTLLTGAVKTLKR
jgi:hypothetical protein